MGDYQIDNYLVPRALKICRVSRRTLVKGSELKTTHLYLKNNGVVVKFDIRVFGKFEMVSVFFLPKHLFPHLSGFGVFTETEDGIALSPFRRILTVTYNNKIKMATEDEIGQVCFELLQ